MVKCIHCQYENPEGEILCIRCGLPLRQNARIDGATRHLDEPIEARPHSQWGTARLGTERKLLLHVRGHNRPLVLSLSGTIVLGRYDIDSGDVPDVDLEEFGAQDLGVSRRHAAIMVEDQALKIMDLGSANFTHMNGQKLIPHQPRILRDGDELRLGRMVINVSFA